MIINNNAATAETNGLESSAFGFTMNAKMYSIMIDKLYKYKEAAVIRELSFNAVDAHKENGNLSTPFDIKLPTWLDKSFYIRDYGTGIDPAKFEEIYTTLGNSTKDSSNEFVGSYGLGSKVPFTMTETYTIENFWNGTKHVYMCFKSAGFPQVSTIGSEPTDEPNGLKVSFAFDKGDHREFERQVTQQLMFLETKPNLIGLPSHEWYKLPDDTSDWFFFNIPNQSSYDTKAYVVMGDVAYPFSMSDIDSELDRKLRGKAIVFRANIGDVDIPPSRETVELTDKTKDFISTKASLIIDSYKETYLKGLSDCSTLVDAVLFCTLNSSDLARIPKDHEVTLANGETYEYSQFSNGSIGSLHLRYFTKSAYNPLERAEIYQRAHNLIDCSSGTTSKRKIYVNDMDRNISALAKLHKDLLPNRCYVASDPKWVKKNIAVESKVLYDKLMALGCDVEYLSNVFPAQVVNGVKVSAKVPVNQVFTVVTNVNQRNSLQSLTDKYTDTAVPTKGYYVEIKGWQCVDNLDIVKVLRALRNNCGIADDIYCIRSKSVKALSVNLKPLSDLIATQKAELLKAERIEAVKNEIQSVVSDTLGMGMSSVQKLGFFSDPDWVAVDAYLGNLDTTTVSWSYTTWKALFPTEVVPSTTYVVPSDIRGSLVALGSKYKDILYCLENGYSYRIVEALEQLKTLVNS